MTDSITITNDIPPDNPTTKHFVTDLRRRLDRAEDRIRTTQNNAPAKGLWARIWGK